MTNQEQLESDIKNAGAEDKYLLQTLIENLERASKENPKMVLTNFFTNWTYDIDFVIRKYPTDTEITIKCCRHGSSVLYPMGFSCGCFENGFCN